MSAGFTPGPWSLETVKTTCGICHKIGPFPGNAGGKGKTHACVYDDYPRNQWTDELEANARLIAAAPALYAAAEKALNYITNTESEFGITLDSGNELRAALKLARGEEA